MPICLDHIVINSTDVERTLAFYRQLFDLEIESLADYRNGTSAFPVLRLSPDFIIDVFPPGLWRADRPDARISPNINHFCLVLDDEQWQQVYKRAKQWQCLSRDAAVVSGARGKGWSFYLTDPDDNLVEVKKYGKGRGGAAVFGE